MATFGTMLSRLDLLMKGHIEQTELRTLINRVHQEEVEAHAWHWRRSNTVINSAAPITTGTVTVTQNSAAVVGVGTSFSSADVGKMIRVGSDEVYFRVTAVGGATALTLEAVWPGATEAGASYFLFPLFYSMPANCEQILSVKRQIDLEPTTREIINRRDPGRMQTANPSLAWAPAGRDSNGAVQFEFWPVNSAAVPYTVEYLAGHTDMTRPSDRPLVPSGVVENKALFDCCTALYALEGDQRWATLAEQWERRYQDELLKALHADRVKYGVIGQVQDVGGGRRFGQDFLPSHDMDD